MTDATTHLFRGNSAGEILDADGKVVGRIVPPEPTEAMALAALKVRLQDRSINGVSQYHAMLSATPADWAQHAVRVPETTGFDGLFAAGMQHALDAIMGAAK